MASRHCNTTAFITRRLYGFKFDYYIEILRFVGILILNMVVVGNECQCQSIGNLKSLAHEQMPSWPHTYPGVHK